MPEGPEVETVRRVLEERLSGATLERIEVPPVTFWRRPDAAALERAALGRRLVGTSRSGKYLVLSFEGGGELVLHLMMSGRLVLDAEPPAARLVLRFRAADGPAALYFADRRRLGSVTVARPRLGPDPSADGFTLGQLRAALRGRRAPVKAVLMDQQALAGVGNIYATEALSRAGIRPGRAAGRITREEAARLCRSLRQTLRRGVALGGSTLRDRGYSDPLGRAGRFQDTLAVYGRKDCGRCGGALRTARRRPGGRTSRYCPECQR
jgi:formamidopyrimidine-DNA glycosylase